MRPSLVEVGLVALGGATGTALRATVAASVPDISRVPIAVLGINIVGAFALGVLLEVLSRSGEDTGQRRAVRLLIGTGLIGGFTTYSTFAVGTAALLLEHHWLAGIGYSLATVTLGAAGSLIGITIGRRVSERTSR